jgi:hypothetical protein
MSELATVGIDLAKSVFQVHGVDESGRVLVRRQLRRSQLLAFFEKRPRCLIGMEANTVDLVEPLVRPSLRTLRPYPKAERAIMTNDDIPPLKRACALMTPLILADSDGPDLSGTS